MRGWLYSMCVYLVGIKTVATEMSLLMHKFCNNQIFHYKPDVMAD